MDLNFKPFERALYPQGGVGKSTLITYHLSLITHHQVLR
jgi:hypothetical protein